MSGLIDRQHRTRGGASPLVEAVTKHKGDWTVRDQDWGGKTNNVDHEIWVPLDDEPCIHCGQPHNDMIRGHELMHTKISPETYGPIKVLQGTKEIPVSAALVEVAEEYRINHSLAQVEGESLVDTGWCDPSIESGVHSVMDQGKFTEVIKLAVAGGPGADGMVANHLESYAEALRQAYKDPKLSPQAKKQIEKKGKVTNALKEAIPAYSTAAARIMMGVNSNIESILDSLDYDFDEEYDGYPEEDMEYFRKGDPATYKRIMEERLQHAERSGLLDGVMGKTLPGWDATEQLAAFLEVNLKEFQNQLRELLADDPPPDLEVLTRRIDRRPDGKPNLNPSEKVEKDGKKVQVVDGSTGGPEDTRWAPYELVEADMPLNMAPWKLQRRNRAVDEGAIPRYMHRWPVDKRVFHRTRRIPGGSLLIDDSGSMGFDNEQLNAIMEAAPMTTVALYAGSGKAPGEIKVVAKDGKRAKTEELSIPHKGGNDIDGPALEWLGEQPYPRVWVTDGGVIDLQFGHAWQTIEYCKRLVLKHKITVVESAEEAAELFRTRKFAR